MKRDIKDLITNNMDSFVMSLLQRCNPFGLTTKEGTSMFFQREVESYFYIMVQTWTLAPRGYIEMPLLLRRLYCHLPFKDCVRVVNGLRTFDIKPVVQLGEWESRQTRQFFCNLCSALCSLTSVPFCSQYVDQAWQLLLQRIEIEKQRKEAEKQRKEAEKQQKEAEKQRKESKE